MTRVGQGFDPDRTRPIIDRFSSLDHLPKTLRPSELEEAVLAVLRVTPRFSVFEVSAEARLANAIADLLRAGRIRYKGSPYPWCDVEVLDAGRPEP